MPKPLPRPDDELNAQFWQHCAQQKLCFQRCVSCGTWRHLPRVMCAQCASPDWEWAESSGRGRLFSWIVTHQAPIPAFAEEAPYAAIVVELEEGVRMLSQPRDLGLEELKLDLPLEVVFERVSDDVALPYFRPRVR